MWIRNKIFLLRFLSFSLYTYNLFVDWCLIHINMKMYLAVQDGPSSMVLNGVHVNCFNLPVLINMTSLESLLEAEHNDTTQIIPLFIEMITFILLKLK